MSRRNLHVQFSVTRILGELELERRRRRLLEEVLGDVLEAHATAVTGSDSPRLVTAIRNAESCLGRGRARSAGGGR